MKLLVACGLCLMIMTMVFAAPQAPTRQRARDNYNYDEYYAQILRYESENDGLGKYRFAFEQSDGTRREEQGYLKNEGSENESLVVKGSYAWVGPDGVTYTVNYTADENGYQPEIEQGPGGGVPPAVVASLLG